MPKFGNCAADAVRTGRPPSVSDRQIRAEIARRLSGAPEELTPFRIQRALEHVHNSIPRLDRIQHWLREMHVPRQAPPEPPREPDADLNAHNDLVRAALEAVYSQIVHLTSQAVLATEDGLKAQFARALAARDANAASLAARHAADIAAKDQEIADLMRHSDDRLDQVDAMRDEMGAERVRLGDINQDLTDRLRRLEEERDVLSRRVQQAEAQAATLQTAARQAYDDATRLNVSLGEAVARMTVAEAECDEARDALTAERDRRVASEAALATAQARLDDTRAALDKLEEVADRERQGTAEIARRLSLAEATLMAERGLVRGTREAGHPQQKPPVNNRMPGELAAARSRGVPDAANGTTPKRLADPPQSGKRRSDLS